MNAQPAEPTPWSRVATAGFTTYAARARATAAFEAAKLRHRHSGGNGTPGTNLSCWMPTRVILNPHIRPLAQTSPYTLTSNSQYPEPQTLHPKSQTLNPKLSVMNP
jgi:hypothetical protein